MHEQGRDDREAKEVWQIGHYPLRFQGINEYISILLVLLISAMLANRRLVDQINRFDEHRRRDAAEQGALWTISSLIR